MVTQRRFVVALLAIALSSQLVQAQLFRCDLMDMGATASMQSMPSSASDEPDAMSEASSGDQDSEHGIPAPSSCTVSVICVIGPAIPAMSQAAVDGIDVSRVIAFAMIAPPTRALRPDFPPPRV